MKNLLSTTFLISALTVLSATAQTTTDPATPGTTPNAATDTTAPALPEIMAPEGFVRQNVVLTAEDLLGATIYDANGDSVGEVSDLVLRTGTGSSSSSTTSGTTGSATGSAAGTDATGSGTAGSDVSGTGTGTTGTGTTGTTGTSGTGTTGTGTDATGTTGTGMSGTDATGAGTAGAGTTATDSTATGMSGTGTADTAGTSGTGTSGTGASATGTMNDSPGATVSASGSDMGEVTHAVLDIGGFLGLGQHRVAVPVSDLAVYRNDTETRVYLPWTEEQLKAVPAYNRDDPSTYGRSLMSNP